MDFADVLRRRKAVRSYLDEPIPLETLERIVERGRKIPSAGHSQGLRLVVVTDGSTRKAIADIADEDHYVEHGHEPWISRAPAHIVVGVREADYHDRYQEADKLMDGGTEIEWPVPYWYVDAGAAVMLLWLAAIDEGLGVGIFGVHAWDGVRELLGLPADVMPVGILTLGKAAPETAQGSAKRGWKPLDEVVQWERWG